LRYSHPAAWTIIAYQIVAYAQAVGVPERTQRPAGY
jgi:hypothetical protein